jgi:WhiB family redox-sensing transcriptional regulator
MSTASSSLTGRMPKFRDRAVCAEVDPEMFFPDKGQSPRAAKKICLGCESRTQCLEWALSRGEEFGVWGGTTPTERRDLRRGRHSDGDPDTGDQHDDPDDDVRPAMPPAAA